MSEFTSTQDIVNDVRFRIGEASEDFDFDNAILRYINRGYRGLLAGGAIFDPNIRIRWNFTRKSSPHIFTLEPAVTQTDIISVTVTNNSTAITFGTAPSQDLTGWHLQIDQVDDTFIIASHGTGTLATLDSVYTMPSGTKTVFNIVKLDYTLPTDFVSFVSPMRSGSDVIEQMSGKKFDITYPVSKVNVAELPKHFKMLNDKTIRFSSVHGTTAGEFRRAEFDYVFIPLDLINSSASIPIIPLRFRHVLSDIALAFIALDKNDDRAERFIAIATATIGMMANEFTEEFEITSNKFGKV